MMKNPTGREILMAEHTLTESEMDACFADLMIVETWNSATTIGDTGYTKEQIAQEVNDYLRCVSMSEFGHDWSERSTDAPRPPLNTDGESYPPIGDLTSSDPANAVSSAFIGEIIEVR